MLTVNDRPTNLLYAEAFPFVGSLAGNYPADIIGWTVAVPDATTRLFQRAGGDGAVYTYEGSVGTTAFYATTASDPGTSGLPFPTISIANTSDLTFAADIAPSTTPTNLTASLAVQINGTTWYVSATNLPVDTSLASATYTTVSNVFSPTATNWNTLSLTGTNATVGSPAGADLSGNLTGTGLVFGFTGAGNFNVDNFQITGTVTAVVVNPGSIAVGTNTATTLTLNWTANPGVRLQSATNLAPSPVWSDVPGTAGQGTATIAKTNKQTFFRLVTP